MTLLYAWWISANYRGAVASCELDVAVDYNFNECVLPLQLAVTIMASWCRQDRCIAAQEVKMSLDFHWVREVLRKNKEKHAALRPECVSDMVCDEGHRAAPCTWIRHGLRELTGNPLSICHLHAWPKPWKMTGGGALWGIQVGLQHRFPEYTEETTACSCAICDSRFCGATQ